MMATNFGFFYVPSEQASQFIDDYCYLCGCKPSELLNCLCEQYDYLYGDEIARRQLQDYKDLKGSFSLDCLKL